MFQAILSIDYLKCLKLLEDVRPDTHNFKISPNLQKFLEKSTIYALFLQKAHNFVMLIDKSLN